MTRSTAPSIYHSFIQLEGLVKRTHIASPARATPKRGAWLALHLCWLCTIAACHGAVERQPATARVTCPRAIELPAALVAAGATTIFGEIHGTREAPALFGDV